MPSDRLLNFARQAVEFVMSQMDQQLNRVQTECYELMQKQVQEVVGTIWIGEGADAFVEEVKSIMMPTVNSIATHIELDRLNLLKAVQEIDNADQAVQQKARELAGQFQSII